MTRSAPIYNVLPTHMKTTIPYSHLEIAAIIVGAGVQSTDSAVLSSSPVSISKNGSDFVWIGRVVVFQCRWRLGAPSRDHPQLLDPSSHDRAYMPRERYMVCIRWPPATST